MAANKARLHHGDIITHFDGKPVAGFDALSEMLLPRRPGEEVMITFVPRSPAATSGTGAKRAEPQTVRVVLSGWQ
jgi:S1-C subfamily serine protease